MQKKESVGLLALLLTLGSSSLVFAAETAAPEAAIDYTKAIIIACSVLAAGLTIGLAAIGTGLGMGRGLGEAASAVGRNPEAQGKILMTMMVGMAMIESLAIYALVIALIVLYANPLLKLIGF